MAEMKIIEKEVKVIPYKQGRDLGFVVGKKLVGQFYDSFHESYVGPTRERNMYRASLQM